MKIIMIIATATRSDGLVGLGMFCGFLGFSIPRLIVGSLAAGTAAAIRWFSDEENPINPLCA